MSDEDRRDDTATPSDSPDPLDDEQETELCCLTCCGDWELDSEDLALLSLGIGVAALVFATFGQTSWLAWLAIPTGVGAVWTGYKALKADTPRPSAALWGLALGAFGLACWLVFGVLRGAWRLVS